MKKRLLTIVIAITSGICHLNRAAGADETEHARMDYVIAVSVPQQTGFRWTVAGRFSGATWDHLWTDLRVSQERWHEWQEAGGRFLVVPEMPVISRLAYIDEGTTSLDPVLLEQECDRALNIVADPDVRTMLRDLQTAAATAIKSGAIVDIYPSAGESIGDQHSSGPRSE